MNSSLLPTALSGAYAPPGWWSHARQAVASGQFGEGDIDELRQDAVTLAAGDQTRAGLSTITDGAMGRLAGWGDIYGRLTGIAAVAPRYRVGKAASMPATYQTTGDIAAPAGLGIVEEFQLLSALVGDAAQATLPGPLSLAGHIIPGGRFRTPLVLAEQMSLILRQELLRLAEKGCRRVRVDEPELLGFPADNSDLVKVLNAAFHGIRIAITLQIPLAANSLGRPGYRRLFPAIQAVEAAEFGLAFAAREMAEAELWLDFRVEQRLAAGVVDSRCWYVETPDEIAARVRLMLRYAAEDRLTLTPDGSLDDLPRRIAWLKLRNLCLAAESVRAEVAAATTTPSS